MTRYVDTSLLVAALTAEAATDRCQAWLAGHPPGDLAISHWVIAEFSAALSVKHRTKAIDADQHADALRAFQIMARRSLQVFSVEGRQFEMAARLADRYELGLRAGDALHLAIARDHAARLCTLDRRLAEAAKALGVDVEPI